MSRAKELVEVLCRCVQPPGDRKAVKLEGPNGERVWIPLSLIKERDGAFQSGEDVVIKLPRWKARDLL